MQYKVDLEVFAGPLDLLLYLIKREEVEIHEVEIAKICDQYLGYIEWLKELDLDLSADFLVMASTLMAIKARSLVPREEVDLDEELDPQDDLIQQLLEYKKYKMLARELGEKAMDRQRRFVVNRRVRDVGDVPLEEVSIFDLVEAFAKIVRETGLGQPQTVIEPEKPIREYIVDLAARLRETPRIEFASLFEDASTRADVIGLFCALLEIMKQKVARAVQDRAFQAIQIELVGDPDAVLNLTDAELGWDSSPPSLESDETSPDTPSSETAQAAAEDSVEEISIEETAAEEIPAESSAEVASASNPSETLDSPRPPEGDSETDPEGELDDSSPPGEAPEEEPPDRETDSSW